MELILEGIKKAFMLIITLDSEFTGITLLSLRVFGIATFMSILIGTVVALSQFPGKKIIAGIIDAETTLHIRKQTPIFAINIWKLLGTSECLRAVR